MIVVAGAFLSAQWPAYRVPGVPRLPGGEVDLNAPAPRTADGRPDLSGTWANPPTFLRFGGVFDVGRFLRCGDGERGCALLTFGGAFDVGPGIETGLPLQPWAAELKTARMAANSRDNPEVWCLPIGNVQFHFHPFPRKIVQAPNVLVMLYETHQGVRQIFLDGRPAPDNDPQPWWYGYSRGWWEGETLVVETTNFRDGGWLDINGSPLTDAARTIERFRRVSYGRLLIEVTIDDPKAYTAPFTIAFQQWLMPDTELIEMVCQENNRAIEHLVY